MCFLTILTYSLFVNNSEKIELWVPFYVKKGPLLVPFLLKIGFPFYNIWVPLSLWNSAKMALQTQAVFVGGVRKVRKVAKITIWVVAQVQMEKVLFMAVKNSKDSLPPTVASSKAVTANCIIVSTDAIWWQ